MGGRWPVKSVKVILGLAQERREHAEFKGLETDNLIITHTHVNQAQKGRRRTYRAHGRINAYLNCPCHVQMILEEPLEDTEKAVEEAKPKKFTRKQLAIRRLQVGGDK